MIIAQRVVAEPAEWRFPLGLVLTAALLLVISSGCTLSQGARKDHEKGLSQEQAIGEAVKPAAADPEAEIKRLRAELSRAQGELELLKSVREIENRSFQRTMEAVVAARDEAIREVVRARSRIQGMASPAEAAAMFAEARVIIDRMNEDAFSLPSRNYLDEANRYLRDGRRELDGQNPGGAAYLFDLISTLYQNFRELEPRNLTVAVTAANLRELPTTKARKLDTLFLGDSLQGLEKVEGWFRVRTASRKEGWITIDLVR